MPLCCVECKPCNDGHCLPGLFKSRRGPAQQLRRAFGKMKVVGGTRRRRRAGSFSSVRAVFWPLMSMRSEADARNDTAAAVDSRPPSASTDDGSVGARRAPSPSLDNDTPRAAMASSTTASRVLALQARLGEAPRAAPQQLYSSLTSAAAPQQLSYLTAAAKVSSIGVAAKAIVVRNGEEVVGDVEAACRSFERHLMEMLVEERKVMDLTDVEELLCCWEKLRCPAFVQLVGRFYGEVCMDLFSARDADAVPSESAAVC